MTKLEKTSSLPEEYADTIADIKKLVQTAQLKAAISVNRELITLCWTIGSKIIEKQTKNG